jgi:uroporphyrinogen-III synthase
MSRKSKSGTDQPLSGIRVLVGRARHQAGVLSTELRKRGAQVIEIPFIEIRKPKSFQPLDAALKNLRTYDWLILTSVNGVESMWDRMRKTGEGHGFRRTAGTSKSTSDLAAEGPLLRVAAIGPATQKAIEQRAIRVDVVPKEYVAESVVRSLKRRVQGKRVLLVRAKVARDVIPHELRKAGAHVDVVEAYETVVPQSSRARLSVALKNPKKRPHVITFTSSSTVRNFVALLDSRKVTARGLASRRPDARVHARPTLTSLEGIRLASIGPVTSSALRELGLRVDIQAKEFTIPGLVKAISQASA